MNAQSLPEWMSQITMLSMMWVVAMVMRLWPIYLLIMGLYLALVYLHP